ncbi:MAG: ABC transporter permease [Spirochaetaceae bacterium]|jgi:lipoprotein-releasing system permease protein|nr:ABC transporter permease [Spirochaetaceae bacterium]
MRVHRWIGFVAARYLSKKRGTRSSPSPVFAVTGIAVGVLALTVIIAVMNGFQLGFIESILEISSYHIRVESFPGDSRPLLDRVGEIPGLVSVVPFRELKGIIRGGRGGQQAAVIRGLEPDVLAKDAGLAARLDFTEGGFDIAGKNSILLGIELARNLGVHTGDEITLVSLSGIFAEEVSPENSLFTVQGIFRTGFYEYDLGWGFINLDTAGKLEGGPAVVSLGIKLRNRWHDGRVLPLVRDILPEGPEASSWRDYNRAFFGALRTEKLLMFVLVGLIFIVVGLNIFQSQRRTVLERREEIGLLRAVGATDRAVRLVFTCDGFFIGLTGAALGMILGILVALNINACIGVLNRLIEGIFADPAGGIFSPAIFYIREIPSRIIPHEVLLIFLFGFLSAVLAAWFASGRVSRIRPAEVLRNE